MKKPGISRIAALIMGLALAIPTGAAAEGWTKTKEGLGLGTTMIENPARPSSKDDPAPWKGSYVYYGQYHTTDDRTKSELTPVKYRVLRNGETRFTDGTPTLFLDCDKILYRTPFDRTNPYTNKWEECTTRSYMNGTEKANDGKVFLGRALDTTNAFSDAEKAAIVLSKYTSNNSTPLSADLVPTGLGSKGDYIFFLDITDVESKDYGYGSNGSRKKEFKYERPDNVVVNGNTNDTWNKNSKDWNSWWLRTPTIDGKVVRIMGITEEGAQQYGEYEPVTIPKYDVGASPAFNVKLSSIVFTSLVSGNAGTDGAEYKLTLLDASMDIDTKTVTPNGNTVTVSYNVNGTNASKAKYVSVLVTDGEWTENGWTGGEVKYYKQFAITVDKSLSFDLPADYKASWKTYILAENVASGEYAANTTDYASAPKQLTLKFITATATGYTGTYDGQPHGINVSVTSPDSGAATVKYKAADGSYTLDESPTITDVANSTLTVYYQITANGYITKSGSADVTISKAAPTITTAPKATSDLTYTGSAQPLVTAGTPKGGTMVYSLEKDKGYSAEIPMGTDAGLYTVYYMVSGDANYNSVTSDDYMLTGTIDKAQSAVTTAPAANNRTYDGTTQPLVTTGTAEGGTMLYATGTSTKQITDWTEIIPTGTNPANYYVWYMVSGDVNHKDTDAQTVTVYITKPVVTPTESGGSDNSDTDGKTEKQKSGDSTTTGGNNSGSGSGNGSSNTGGKAEEQKSGDSSATDGSSNGSDSSNNGQKVTVGFEKAHKEVADVVEKKLTELLPGLPDDVEFFSDPDNMEFKGVNGLTSYIEKIIDELKGTVRELTAVMSPVSVKTAGVYFVKVNVTEEQSKELIGTRNLAYHIELYLENKEEAQVRIADAGEGESDVPTGKFVDENGDVVSGAYGGGDIYLLVYVPKADTTYVQYMTAEADQKPLEETTGNSSSPTSDSTSPSGYSGPTSNKGPGGCDAGFGGLAGLMILPLLARRRKK